MNQTAACLALSAERPATARTRATAGALSAVLAGALALSGPALAEIKTEEIRY